MTDCADAMCGYSWNDRNTIRVHVCLESPHDGDHTCTACGATCPTTPGARS